MAQERTVGLPGRNVFEVTITDYRRACVSHLGWRGGLEIVENSHLTRTVMTKRSRRERWLTWPWRPWRRRRPVELPDPHIWRVGNWLVMHPKIAEAVRQRVARYGQATLPIRLGELPPGSNA